MSAPGSGVLIVDVDALRARALAAILRRDGEAVEIAHTAADARRYPRPEALVVAAGLPDNGAWTLLASYEAEGPPPWTMVLAPSTDLDTCRRALRAGARDVVADGTPPEAIAGLVLARPRELPAALPGVPSRASFEERYETRPASMLRAVRDVLGFALRGGLGPAVRARIGSALAEVVENAWEHAYAEPGATGPLRVRASLDQRELVVVVVDDGRGFDCTRVLRRISQEASLSGLARAKALCESFEVRRNGGRGTRVELRFAAYSVDFDEEDLSVDLTDRDWLTPEHSRRILHELGQGEAGTFHLSPSLAVALGRLLAAPGHPTHRVEVK